MCSIGDDNFEENENSKYMPTNGNLSECNKCNKCRAESPWIVLRSKDKYCKHCFITGTTHKFKAVLGKHKLIRPNDRVMVVHKCGHASTALLHFIRTGLDLETHKKLRFEPVVLFIEDSFHLTSRERRKLVLDVQQEIDLFNFPTFFTTLSQLLATSSVETVIKSQANLLEFCDGDQVIRDNFLKGHSSITNKNDFLNITMRQLWIDIAKHLSCKFIFSPEISVDVASQLLTDISLGRGLHIPLNIGFCDYRDDIVKILRPLRTFDSKELAFYNYLHKLEPVTFRLNSPNTLDCVQVLMKKFVNGLQENYPATVTTVLKTGDKLAVNLNLSKRCLLCKAPVEEENLDLTSAESTKFSHWVSTHSRDGSATPQEQYADILKTFDNFSCNDYCFSCSQLAK